MADRPPETRHEIIKVPDNNVAWIYIHSQNGFTYVAPHWHRDLEITYMLEGNAEYVINGHKTILNPGELLLVNDGSVHSCRMSTHIPSDAISVIFPYSFITQFQKKTGAVYFTLNKESTSYPKLIAVFRQLYDKLLQKGHDPFYQLDVNRFVFDIASLLFHCFLDKNQPGTAISSERYRERCQDITGYIDSHFSENLTLENVASKFNVSKEHFSRIFREYMGITFKKYLTKLRMHHAYTQLVSTDLTLLEISLNNGFPDYRTFIQNFKNVYGITPLKYRKIKENTDDSFSLKNAADLFLRDETL